MDVFSVPRGERKKRKEKYLGFSNLLPFADRLAGNLSGGMKQKLGLACVLVHEPGPLILDEPTNGSGFPTRILGHSAKHEEGGDDASGFHRLPTKARSATGWPS